MPAGLQLRALELGLLLLWEKGESIQDRPVSWSVSRGITQAKPEPRQQQALCYPATHTAAWG